MSVKLSELPKEIQDAICIEDCHVSGMHDPSHTTTRVCEIQLSELAIRVLKAIGIDYDLIQDQKQPIEKRVVEINKIPRKIKPNSWYDRYKKSAPEKAKELEEWQKNGIKVTPKPEKAEKSE